LTLLMFPYNAARWMSSDIPLLKKISTSRTSSSCDTSLERTLHDRSCPIEAGGLPLEAKLWENHT